MTNLFSSFDPLTLNMPLNWVSSFLIIMLMPPMFWMSHNQALAVYHWVLMTLESELKQIMGPAGSPGSTAVSAALFGFILLNNLQGLAPYVFTSSGHLPFAVAMALPLWIGHIVYSWWHQPNHMLAHMVPLGTPVPLMPFMVVIEIVSNIIRPLTLSIRLVANMVAGHLLLGLFGASSLAFPATLMLCALEFAVAMIQAYVFSVLSTLYLAEAGFSKSSLR